MASCNFKNAKLKGATASKMRLRHCSKEGRKYAKKRNKNINLDKTKDNISVFGLSYKQCCDKYDERIAEIDANGNSNKRKDRVTMLCIEVPAPADLPEEQREAWFCELSKIMLEFFGPDNMIEGFWHVDEIHPYIEPESKKKVWSRPHGHFCGVPEVQNGTLNAKKLTARANIIKLNRKVDEMSRKEFNCEFLTGTKKRSFRTVSELKEMSAYAEYEMELEKERKELEEERNQLRAHREALESLKREIEEKEENARKLHEKAAETYREAVRIEQESLEKMRAVEEAKEAEDADQPQAEKTRSRKLPWEFEMLLEKWERQRLGLPEPDMKQVWADLEHRRIPGDSMEVDAAQEAQEEEYRIPFEFRGLVSAGVHPSDEDEMGF